jgi:uncharacterized protein (TIGR04255 family)
MENENKNTLERNRVSRFLLKIDLTKDSQVDFSELARRLSDDYETHKTENHINYMFNVETENVKREEFLTYILSNQNDVNLRLNSFEKSIVIDTSHYINNSIYKDRLNQITGLLNTLYPETRSMRIGMRYINKFDCNKTTEISKILTTEEATAIKNSLKREGLSRTMFVHEYLYDDCRSRIQFGIPNQFYPSIIRNYELVLDIDVYNNGSVGLNDWDGFVSVYNHRAYDIFTQYVKETYRETLK